MNADKDQIELDYLDETDGDCPNPEKIRLLDRQPQVRVRHSQNGVTFTVLFFIFSAFILTIAECLSQKLDTHSKVLAPKQNFGILAGAVDLNPPVIE